MLRELRQVPALLALVAFAAAQLPKLRLSEVEEIAPTGYQVDLTLDPDADTFAGSITIRVDVRKPAQTIWLNASRIRAQDASVTAAGRSWTAKAVQGGDDFLGLQLESPVPAGAAEIRIRYTGTARLKDSSGVFRTEDTGNHYLLTQFEATFARNAFPCFDEPSYKVPWQLTLHVPAQDQAISNTPVLSEKSEGALKTYVFQRTKPLPSYLIAFGVGPFEFVDAGHAGKNHVPVRIVTPKGRADEAKYAAEVTATILTRLEDYFGIAFPYEKADLVAVPVTVGFGAMENAGMVTYTQTFLLAKPATDNPGRQRTYARTAAHELAHQWFGDLVTMDWWDDIWLNESFATWMEQKLIAEWKPDWQTRLDAVDAKLLAEEADSLMTARKIRQAIETRDDIANVVDPITYEKGAAVIGMFESWIGPEKFQQGVRSYLQQHAFQNATAGDFLDSLGSAAKQDVARPFSTFLNQAGVPLVSVALDCKQKTPVLHLEQARFVPLGSKGSAGQVWSIPVCVRYARGTGQSECTLMTRSSMDWALRKAASCPAFVEANIDAKGYYRVDYQGGLLEALSGGGVVNRLSAAERVDLIGNAASLASAGRMPSADALGLVPVFHEDPVRDVVERALTLALSVREHLVPPGVMPNYQRFLLTNFQARARELGWLRHPGEPDEVRLLRPQLVQAIATFGGDQELAAQAPKFAEEWLQDRGAEKSMISAGPVLRAAAYYGDMALFSRMLAEFKKTRDRGDQLRLLNAMTSFRDRTAIEAGMQAVLSGNVALVDGFPLLLSAGRSDPETRTLPFEFLRAHFEEIMKDHPSMFGNDFGSLLPRVGESFCDPKSRNELQAFFAPRVDRYAGAPRVLAQVLEGIDLCIAQKKAQEESVRKFLEKY